MAMANIELKCCKCEKYFTHKKNCYSREEANSYEEWAKDNIDTCPECYKAEQDQKKYQQADEIISKYNIAIEGTEKQVNYVKILLCKYVECHSETPLKRAFENECTPDMMCYKILHTSDCKELIDLLKQATE